MPMKLNVGLSRKVGEANYGSRGATVNVEVEVDGGLVGEPDRLRERIRQLFGLVRASVTEELANGGSQSNGPPPPPASPADRQDVPGNANGQRSAGPRPATSAQVKAIYAMARRKGLDLGAYLQDRCRVVRPE